jgi:hypothetical protein
MWEARGATSVHECKTMSRSGQLQGAESPSTLDGGVIGASGAIYDANGNATGHLRHLECIHG